MDREAWQAAVHGVAKSWTRLSNWTELKYVKGRNYLQIHSFTHSTRRPGSLHTLQTSSSSVQFNSVSQLCPTLCDPMDCSTPGFLVLRHSSEFAQTHVHRVGDAIQPSHPLSSPSPPTFNLSQHQGLFQWVGSSHQVSKVLKLQLQHQSFQWIFRTDFL